jgi:predicted 2-oxoglutarate/Fe(II)-dependent dioxygenase YbiX
MFDYVKTHSNLLSNEDCDIIINHAIESKFKPGMNLTSDDRYFYNSSQRKCQTIWFHDNIVDKNIDTILKNYSLSFAIDTVKADHSNKFIFQVTKYEVGDFHNWHIDDNLHRTSGIRKFVTIISLSNPTDYEGGELEIEGMSKLKMEKGSSISFLTSKRHRVLPITNGLRYSLVVWLLGPPWR